MSPLWAAWTEALQLCTVAAEGNAVAVDNTDELLTVDAEVDDAPFGYK